MWKFQIEGHLWQSPTVQRRSRRSNRETFWITVPLVAISGTLKGRKLCCFDRLRLSAWLKLTRQRFLASLLLRLCSPWRASLGSCQHGTHVCISPSTSMTAFPYVRFSQQTTRRVSASRQTCSLASEDSASLCPVQVLASLCRWSPLGNRCYVWPQIIRSHFTSNPTADWQLSVSCVWSF